MSIKNRPYVVAPGKDRFGTRLNAVVPVGQTLQLYAVAFAQFPDPTTVECETAFSIVKIA